MEGCEVRGLVVQGVWRVVLHWVLRAGVVVQSLE